jgi:hypothetical protein
MPSLERGLGLRHQLAFVDADALVEKRMCGSVASPTPTMPISLDSIRRMRRFAGGRNRGEGGGRHPAGGATADDDDVERNAHGVRRRRAHGKALLGTVQKRKGRAVWYTARPVFQ